MDEGKRKFSEILCFSGGLDSFIAWNYLKKPPALFFELGHRYCERERKTVDFLSQKYGISVVVCDLLDIGSFEEPDANLPLRNLYLVMLASHFADRIHLIVQRGEMSIPDRSERFFRETSDFLSFLHGRPITVATPFSEMTKVDMVDWYLNENLPFEGLLDCYSCFEGKAKACGMCAACFRKFIALEANGLSTEGHFSKDLLQWEGVDRYVKNLAQYEPRRREQIIRVLKAKGLSI